MTEAKLAKLVSESVDLDRQIQDLTEQLKERKELLVIEATSRQDEHAPTENGGTSWTATAADGSVARVMFPAPSLKSKIDAEAKGFNKVKEAAGKVFDSLFKPTVTWRLIAGFRDEATKLLGKEAPKLIRLCQTESTPKVAFETTDRA